MRRPEALALTTVSATQAHVPRPASAQGAPSARPRMAQNDRPARLPRRGVGHRGDRSAVHRPFRSVLTSCTNALVTLIRSDVAAGRLHDDLDTGAAVSLFVGGYFGELVRRGTVDEGFTERCRHLMRVAMTGGHEGT
jgi:hypothetical protein